MCELVAMSARYPTNLTLSLKVLAEHSSSGGHADGWGIAYYNRRDAWRIRDTAAAFDSPWARFVEERGFTSSRVMAHIRKATRGDVVLENTQPFERELGGRVHLFAHNGDLPDVLHSPGYASNHYRPIGTTDSEIVFCHLMDRLREPWLAGDPPAFNVRWRIFQEVCAEFRPFGPANFLYSDSNYLFIHGNQRTQNDGVRRPPGLYWLCRECSHEGPAELSSEAITVKDEAPSPPETQKVVLVASVPLTDEHWQPLMEGEMLALSEGEVLDRAVPADC